MGILPEFMSVHHMRAWFLRKSGESIRSQEQQLRKVVNLLMVLGIKSGASAITEMHLASEPFLQPLMSNFELYFTYKSSFLSLY